MKNITLSVIIPCFDEIANLQRGVLDKVRNFLEKKGFAYEVIIVDDGSRDGSIEYITQFVKENKSFRLIQNPHLGKAGAVTTGILKAEGEYILFTDMDQATPIEELDKIMNGFKEDYDIVIGSRGVHRQGAPVSRLIISWGSILLRKLIIGLGDIQDTQCGFKAFKREPAQRLFTKIHKLHHGFKKISGSAVTAGFDMELLFLARKMGYSIKEVPVRWLYVETRRVSPVKDSIEGIIDLFIIKKKDIAGTYKNL